MKRHVAIALTLALVLTLASPTAFGVADQSIVHRDLGMRSFSSAYYGGVRTPRDAASGLATGRSVVGGLVPGGAVISFIAENGSVMLGTASDPTSASVVMTLPAGHVGQLDFSASRLVVLEGVPVPDKPGFVTWPHMHQFDSTTGERSFSATVGPDMEPDTGGWMVGWLDADSDDDGVAFVVNSHATPGVDVAAYSSLVDFLPTEVTRAPSIRGLSLDQGRLAYNSSGFVHVALASHVATSFSWGLSQTGGLGLGGGRVVGAPSLQGSTVAWTEAAAGAARGDVFVADLNSGLTSQVSRSDAATDVPGPVLTDDAVYWARDAGDSIFITPIGGTRRVFVLPHVLEKSGIRADDLSTSQVATLGGDPSPLSIGNVPGTRGVYTEYSGGARKVHAIHLGERLPAFTTYRLLPTVNKRGVTISVSLTDGPNPSVPLAVESRTTSGGAGKANFQDFHFRTSVSPASGVYTVTFDEVAQRTLFRFTFPGDGTFGSAESRLFEFAPTPVVTIGIKPARGLVKGSTFTISGRVITPRAEVGVVRGTAALVIQRKTSRGWLTVLKRNPLYQDKGVAGENPFYESKNLRLRVSGQYRAQTSVPANDFHQGARSAWLSFKVK